MESTRPETGQIWHAMGASPEAFFVQVGSNDGVQGDPLHPLIVANQNWRGLFIEPVPYLFGRLRENYSALPRAAERFRFENVAVANHSGRRPFYYVDEGARKELGDDLPFWHDQLGSFSREHIVAHLEGRLEPHIVVQDVECRTLDEVLSNNDVERIDLLHIDAEGSDYDVLQQLDWQRWLPRVIVLEHIHLAPQDRTAASELMRAWGYEVRNMGHDFLAWRIA